MRKPMPKERYQDKRGQIITIKSCIFNRVIFVRAGYQSECTYPLNRFASEFTFAGEKTDD